jgi:NAD(P) transhydrogenase subunit alpha
MAAEQGGNCEGSEINRTVTVNGVRIMGYTNLPAMLPTDASSLYARNVLDFLKLIINDENELHIPSDDDIVSATLVVNEGKIWN